MKPKLKAATSKKSLVPAKKPALKTPKLTKKAPAKISTKLIPTKLTKAVPKKGLAKLQLYMKAKPVFENMGAVVSPKTLTRKPGEFSLGKAVKKNAKYNAKMIPKEAKKVVASKLQGLKGMKLQTIKSPKDIGNIKR